MQYFDDDTRPVTLDEENVTLFLKDDSLNFQNVCINKEYSKPEIRSVLNVWNTVLCNEYLMLVTTGTGSL